MLRKIIQECIQQHSFSFHFLFYQAYADNEASTRLLQIVMFLLYCPPLLSCSFLSFSFTLSIYFFGCLPLLLVPSTCPYSATAGSPSLLHVRRLYVPEPCQPSFPDFVYECNLLSQVLSGLLSPYLVSSGPTQQAYYPQPVNLCHQYQFNNLFSNIIIIVFFMLL